MQHQERFQTGAPPAPGIGYNPPMTTDPAKLSQLLLDVSPTPLIQVDAEGLIVRMNRACTPLLGYAADELIGQAVEVLLPEERRSAHRPGRRYFLADPVRRPMGDGREIFARRRDGTPIPVAVQLVPLVLDAAAFVVAAIEDLTDRRKMDGELRLVRQQLELANRQLGEVALTDSLTGARNRVAFYEDLSTRLALAQRSDHPVSVVLVDVDGFDEFNAAHGPQAGDDVLKRLAGLLRYTARQSDLVHRTAADEFGAILPETGAAGARRCGERVVGAVVGAEWVHGPVTVSLGAATFDPAVVPPHAGGVDELRRRLVQDAGRALAHAKSQGAGNVIHADAVPPASEPEHEDA